MLSGYILDRLGLKLSLIVSFLTVLAGCCLYLALSQAYEYLIPILLLVSSFGISSVLNIDWNGNSMLFPVIYASSTNGLCNFFARFSNVLAPQVAEIP
jgi:MFS family permease